ncbi:MAG: Extracellular solute-binding protein family 5, partial [Microgenomates group bacterium GW2011_GWA2_46_16]
MIFFRKSRFLLLVTRELSRKYTFPLIVGFFLGLVGMIGFHQITSRFSYQPFAPVLRVGLVGDATPSILPFGIQELISGGLTRLGQDGLPLSSLATKWEATDSGRTFVFTIAENARWHNGLGVKAGDINYNIRDVTFTVISPYALRATLKEPFAPFLTLVAKPILLSGLKGFGQYRVKNIRLKGEAVQYLHLESVNTSSTPDREYRFYRTESAAVTGFQLGDIDVLEDISSSTVFEGWKNASVSAQPHYNRVVALYFNTKDPVLGEKGFRQALGFAIPDVGFERAYSPISKTSWAYTDTVKKYDFDLNQAKKLMANA